MNAHVDVPQTSEEPTIVIHPGTYQGVDAGDNARRLVKLRKAAVVARKVFFRTIALVVVLSLLSVAAAAYYGYTTRVGGYKSVETKCSFMLGDQELTGTRIYSYPFQEYFGFRLTDTKQIEEKTRLNTNGNPLQVIGLEGDTHWVQNIGMGERGFVLLNHADSYVFTSGKVADVVKYKSFCK